MRRKSYNNPTAIDCAQWTRMLWGAASALALSLFTTSVQAQTWLGDDATNPNDFNFGANWSTGTVPGFNQTATFGNAGSTSVNVTAEVNLGSGGLRFDAAAPAFTINLQDILVLTSISNDSGAIQTINLGQSWLGFSPAGSVAGPVTINQSGTGIVQFDAAYDASAASVTTSGPLGGVLVRGDGATVSIGSLNGSNGRVAFQSADSMIEVGALNQDDTFTGFFTTQNAGTGGIRKVGTGTQWLSLQFRAGFGSYTGPTEVASGTLNMGTQYSFGAADSGTTVASGATLGLYGNSYIVGSETISLAGTGVGDGGALRNLENIHQLSGAITLTGGTRINSDAGLLMLSGTITRGAHQVWFGGAGDITISGNIDGSGGVTKDGAGTLTLSGSNTYSGQTNVQDGILRAGAADVFSARPLYIHPTATVELNGFNQTVGALAGDDGAELSLGTATFTMAGIVGLASSRYDGDIYGAGSIIKEGAHAQIMYGTNTYSGATQINNGDFWARGQNSLSANSVHVLAAGAALSLTDFDQTIGSLAGAGEVRLLGQSLTSGGDNTSTTFAGVLIGAGGFTKVGAGTQTFTGANTYTGTTNVDNGTLVVGFNGAGSIVSNVTVGGAGTLQGTGAVGGVTVASDGVHAPGNSIGTQTVNGPYLLQAGAILEIETNAAGQSDLVIVNGTVDLTGATLRVLAEGGNYSLATSYLIIDNDGADAVSGTFGAITSNLAFLDPTLVYDGGDGNDVVLTLTRNDVSFTDVAQTANQFAVASGLNGLPVNNPLVVAVFGQSAEGARQAFDALSGEVHATLGSTLARDARFTRGAIFSRLQQAHHGSAGANGGNPQTAALGNTGTTAVAGRIDAPMMGLGMGRGERASAYDAPSASPLVFWTQAFGSWADADGDGNAASAKRNIGGFLSGVDTHIGSGWRAGLALGYSRSNVSVSQRISSAEIDSTHLAAYAGGSVGSFALRGGGSWSWNDIDTERTVVFPGFLDRVEADYDGDTGQVFGEIALPLGAGAFAYEPFANLAYVHVSTDRFTEQGGVAALTGFGGDQDVGYSTVGVRFAWESTFVGARVTPRASFAWQHAFGDVDPTRLLAFSGAPGMTIAGTPLARNAALIEAGLDFALSPSATLGVAYNGEIASDIEDHGVSGRLNWRF